MREHGGDRREGRERRNDKRKQSAPASYLLHLSETVKGPLGSSHNEECHLRGGKEGSKRRSLPFAFLSSVPLLFHGELPAVEREGDGKRWRRGGVGGSGRKRKDGEGVFLRLRTVMNEEGVQRSKASSF